MICDGKCGLEIEEGDRFVHLALCMLEDAGPREIKNEGNYCCSFCLQIWMETLEEGPREHAVICSAAERIGLLGPAKPKVLSS